MVSLVLHPPSALLSEPEERVLESLARGADPVCVAAAHNLSLASLAHWLAEPHVREALDALRALFDLQRDLWRGEVAREAVETLREVMRASDSPAERRRAATTVLRAVLNGARRASEGHKARSTREESLNGARRASEGHRARSAGEGPSSPRPPHPPAANAPPTDAPSETPDSSAEILSADAAADRVLHLLHDHHSAADAFAALGPHLAERTTSDPEMLGALRASLADFLPLLHSAHLAAAPALVMNDYACTMLTFTRAGAPPIDYALILGCPPGRVATGPWALVAINPDSSG